MFYFMIQQLSVENYYMPGSVFGNRDSEQNHNYPCNHGAYIVVLELLGGSEVKASACNAGDLGLISGSGRSPGGGNGTPVFLLGESPWTEEPDGLQSMG